MTSKQVTLPPRNSRKLLHSKEMVWAWRWSVALRISYRQILSLLYSSFFFWNFRHRLARELLVVVAVVLIVVAVVAVVVTIFSRCWLFGLICLLLQASSAARSLWTKTTKHIPSKHSCVASSMCAMTIKTQLRSIQHVCKFNERHQSMFLILYTPLLSPPPTPEKALCFRT